MVSQTTGYALTAIGYLAARREGSILSMEIAQATGIPFPYLSKILHRLTKHKILTSKRGRKGGVALAVPPRKLTLYDICLAMDEPLLQEKCILGTAQCSDTRNCPCHFFWKPAREKAIQFLKKTSVKHLAKMFSPQRGTL